MPERVQLRRTKGWRMPVDAVKVTRPGPWGNPYVISEVKDVDGRPIAKPWWVDRKDGSKIWMFATKTEAHEASVKLFRHAMTDYMRDKVRIALRGKNLACWCKPGEPCHADVLLEIAND